MVFGRILELVRGSVAWAFGYGVTLLLVVLGIVDQSGDVVRAAAEAYLAAHVVPPLEAIEVPLYLVAVPVLVVGLAGYHAGHTLRSGVGGRLRSYVQSMLRTERYRLWQAVLSGTFLAVGYTIAAAAVAVLFEVSLLVVIVGSLLFGLVIAIPSAVVGTLD